MRQITVIPEIEMPGHATAALASYPELGCTGGPYEVVTRWGIFEDAFCAGNEHTFEFLENVLSEVVELFPSRYIHIGGDECLKNRWKACPKCQERIKTEGLADEDELQSYFIRRIEKFLLTKNRNIIGWDEILEGGLAPQATVMSWRGVRGGIEAAQMGHDVIMSPVSHCYFDYYQADPETQPLAIGGYITLNRVYEFNPIPEELNERDAKHILGAQGNVWTEYMKTPEHVEYMAYPRAIALAEVLWTPQGKQNFENFSQRLEQHLNRLDKLNVNYFKP
jgi:hexosaminidase